LFQTDFLTAVGKALVPGGEFLFMTDHEEYFQWAEGKVGEVSCIERVAWDEKDFFYPKTDFQQLWESEGKAVWRMRCRKPVSAV
jgi:tRNA (guanine-N7-)-methyltransferase